jgi:hypothetical protein
MTTRDAIDRLATAPPAMRVRLRIGIATRLLSVFVAVMMIVATGSVLFLAYLATPAQNSVYSSRDSGGLLVVSSPSTYFPNGYYSHEVNFSLTHSGDAIVIGNVSFLYLTPSNLEMRTTTRATGNTTTTVAVVTADYQCGTSLGQRQFFFAQLSGNSTVKLDYCLVLNTATAQSYPRGSPHAWALAQVSTGTSPLVAIYLAGTWDRVYLVELWVEK